MLRSDKRNGARKNLRGVCLRRHELPLQIEAAAVGPLLDEIAVGPWTGAHVNTEAGGYVLEFVVAAAGINDVPTLIVARPAIPLTNERASCGAADAIQEPVASDALQL